MTSEQNTYYGPHFRIDIATKELVLISGSTILAKNDHNSKKVTFEIPKIVEGYDISACNSVRVNYLNVDAKTKEKHEGYYDVKDFDISEENENIVKGSWEISGNATRAAGGLSFTIHFFKLDSSSEIEYAWNTGFYNELKVVDSGDSPEAEDTEFFDIFNQWKEEIEERLRDVVIDSKVSHSLLLDRDAANQHPIEAITGLSDQLETVKIINDASGNALVLTDSSKHGFRNLKIYGKSVQSGTPAPSTPAAIRSVVNPVLSITNKNILGDSSENGYISTTDGSVAAEASARVGYYIPAINTNLYILIPAYDGTASNSYIYRVGFYDENKKWISTLSIKDIFTTVNVPKGAKYFRCSWVKDTQIAVYIQSRTEYIEPNNQTLPLEYTLPGIPVSSGGNYTDLNGQHWIADEIDFKSGVYIKRVASPTISAAWEVTVDNSYVSAGGAFLRVSLPEGQQDILVNPNISCLMSPTCLSVSYNERTQFTDRYRIFNSSPRSFFIRMPISDGEITADKFNEFIGSNIKYIMATPVEKPLSDAEIAAFKSLKTNRPATTIVTDSAAEIYAEYVATSKGYIDKKIEELKSAILSIGGNV